MNSIGYLCSILASRETTVRAAAFGGWERLAPLISSGVLVPVGAVATAICTECDMPHMVDVETVGNQAGWYCPQAGFVEPGANDLVALFVRCQALAEQLSAALGWKRGVNAWPTQAPILWSLGEFEFGKLTIAAYLVPNLGDLLIAKELGRFLRSPRGNPHATAILTNDDRDLNALILPDGVRVVALTDAIGFDSSKRLSINLDTLARRVLPERLLRPPGRGRRPMKREEAYKIIAGLDQEHKLDGLSEREQHRLTRTQLQARQGKRAVLGWATFKDALLAYRSRAKS
jgi:hypothetical protein